MKSIRILFMTTTFTLTILLAYTLPAMAATPANSLIFFPVPHGPGGTYSCSSGPPFVSDTGSNSPQTNCTLQQSGAPSGLRCDTPTTVTFAPTVPEVPGVGEYVADGRLCH